MASTWGFFELVIGVRVMVGMKLNVERGQRETYRESSPLRIWRNDWFGLDTGLRFHARRITIVRPDCVPIHL